MPREAQEHLEWILSELRANASLATSAELRWFTYMEAHAADASAALQHALEHGHIEQGLELAVLMARYWWVLGSRREGRAWLGAFLERSRGERPDQEVQAQVWLQKLVGEDDPA